MSTVNTEQYQPLSSQDIALNRLAASRQEIRLLAHLLQASMAVERSNPLRQTISEHREMLSTMTIMIVILLSIIAGVLTPQITQALGIY
jgi:hypothetical protein